MRSKRESLAPQLEEAQRKIVELEVQLRSNSERDPLTGLASLSRFRAALEIEADRSRRHGRALAVAILDIDGFRNVNTRHGHAAGDAVLQVVGRTLTEETRGHDVIARMAGDEFAVLMPEADTEGACSACQRIVKALECVPVSTGEGVSISAGVASFDRSKRPAAMLGAASEALDRARAEGGGRVEVAGGRRERSAEKQRDAVSALAVALLERDRYTGEHSESVVDMAGAVARALSLDDDEVHRVQAAALLHDIGKVAIPDEILHKPGQLDEDQWKIMREHPVIGERILRAIPGLGGVARIVRHEHERWDGSGYPDGLAGNEIPIGSRIILACDAYHAMTTDRPYRNGMSHAEAIAELGRNAGNQFDPDVTEVLIGYLYGTRQGAGAGPTPLPHAGSGAAA